MGSFHPGVQTTVKNYELTIWCEPLRRHRLGLVNGDITKAIQWFKDTTKHNAMLVVLNPSNKHFAQEISSNIKVEFRASCLAFEVGLAAETEEAAQELEAEILPQNTAGEPATDRPKLKPGRPRSEVTEDILKGPGSIRYKARLAGVSFGTIKRRLEEL